jgi:CheY-like chemotaxis protein
MPELDGVDATIKISELEKSNDRCIPIIALTDGVMKEEHDKCINAGMNAFITKPIEPDKFLKAIKRFQTSQAHEDA